MSGKSGESTPSVLPDLTGISLDELLDGSDAALARAARRVMRQTAGAEPPISAYDSGAQFLPPEDAGELPDPPPDGAVEGDG